MSVSDLVTILGALGVGSIFGQYLIGGQQRREIRSRVLSALEKLEDVRWSEGPGTQSRFPEARHQLETAALIARVPRHVVSHYILLAEAAWRMSERHWEEKPDLPESGAIDIVYANLVTEAAGDLAHCAWSPWFAITLTKRRAAKRMARIETLDQEVKGYFDFTRSNKTRWFF